MERQVDLTPCVCVHHQNFISALFSIQTKVISPPDPTLSPSRRLISLVEIRDLRLFGVRLEA